MENKAILQNNPILVMFFILAGTPLFFYSSFQGMVHTWLKDTSFIHCFLVFPIAILLIWNKRHILATVPVQSEPRVLVLLVLVSLAWLISNIAGAIEAEQFVMIATIITVAWVLLGRFTVAALIFPLLFLFLAIPVGEVIIPPGMRLSADFTVSLLRLTNIPVYQEPLYLTLPNARLSVIDTYSGIRYLIGALVLGIAYSYVTFASIYKRLVFIFCCLVTPVLIFGFRAYGIIIIKYQGGWQLPHSLGFLKQDWIFLIFIIISLVFIGYVFKKQSIGKNRTQPDRLDSGAIGETHISFYLIVPVLILVSAPKFYSIYLDTNQHYDNKPDTIQLSQHYGGWQLDPSLNLNWKPPVENSDLHITHGYRFGSDVVQISISHYDKIQDKIILGAKDKFYADNEGWKSTRVTEIQEPSIYVTESELISYNKKLLVWSWYRIGSYRTPKSHIANLLGAFNQILHGSSDGYWITIATPFHKDKEDSRSQLRQFWSEAGEQINLLFETF